MSGRTKVAGWSLLEILVVVAIGAVLLTLLSLVALRAIQNAKSAQCIANLRQLGVGFLAYAADNGMKFPAYPTNSSDNKLAWPWLISDYVGYNRDKRTPAVFVCPAGQKHPNYPMSALRGYSMNHFVSDASFNNNTPAGDNQMLLVEEWGVGTTPEHVMWPALGSANNKTYQNYSSSERKERLAWRHNGGMNVLRKDGSVIHSLPGKNGWGEAIIWRIQNDGKKWRDGNWE